jgi:hypothetical protein
MKEKIPACFFVLFFPHMSHASPNARTLPSTFQMLMLMQLLLTNAGQLLPNL